MGHEITQRERDIWRAALTLANNICVQESDAHNADDEIAEAGAAGYCAERIRGWLDTPDDQMAELFQEAGVHVERDFMGEALNSGDGTYRP